MSRTCDLCLKRKQIGRQSRHHRGVAGKQWMKRAPQTLRVFEVNLHKITIDGVRMKLCAKCIKLLKKNKADSIKKASLKKAKIATPVVATA